MGEFIVVFLVAAITTALATPLVIRFARHAGAIDKPADPRKVHKDPVPTLGGLSMLAGFLAAMFVAGLMPGFREVFESTSEPLGLLIGVCLIVIVGVVDDVRGLPPTVKVAGQILATLGPVLFGIQLVYAWIPGLDVVSLAADLGMPLTVLLLLAMVNAVNLIDGLDGLAAGVVGIAAIAFFGFALLSSDEGITQAVPTAAPLTAAILAGMCVGFLVHNFHPAKIFMGDTGAMMLGLLLGSAGISYVGRSTAPSTTDFAGTFPLLVPVLVLAIPFADTAFAVARRAYKRQPLSTADKGHLHHLLIAFGHSHRRAVLVLYYWSAAFAGGAIAIGTFETAWVVAGGLVALVVGVSVTAFGIRASHVEERVGADAQRPHSA